MTKLLKILPFLIVFLSLTMGAAASHAQVPGLSALTGGSDKKAETQSVTVNSADLKKLITTLESEAERKKLIDNLKTLESAAAKPEATTAESGETPEQAAEDAAAAQETIAPITQTLGVESFTNRVISRYQHFLVRNDLNESTFGKLILTTVLLVTGGILIFISRRGATKMLYWFDRAIAWMDLPAARMRIYARVVRGIVTVLLMGLLLYTLTLIWDFGAEHNASLAHMFRAGMGTIINLVFVIALAVVAWEFLNALIEMGFRRADGANSTRAKTIIPIVRNILFMVFAIMFTLVLLSEIGINILPLLAGAGIVGVAVGFGAQTMVKDFLSGFTLILEDVMRVGDVVNIGGYGGLVEKITLRKVQLRDYNGSVYTVPFSEIKTVTNLTKDFSMYQIDIGVSYKDDPDKVFEVMRKVDEEMRNDPSYQSLMLAPIEIAGVDRFADSSVIIKARLKTTPINQWTVGREYNRRMKKAFAENNIEIPFPQQVTWNANPQVTVFKQDKGDFLHTFTNPQTHSPAPDASAKKADDSEED
jgi:small conductance mechanosensitive channel